MEIPIVLYPYSFGSASNNPNNYSLYFYSNLAIDGSDGSFVFYPYASVFNAASSFRRVGFNYLSTDYIVASAGGNCSSVNQSPDNTGNYPKIVGLTKNWLQAVSDRFHLDWDLSSVGSTSYLYIPVITDSNNNKVADFKNAVFASSYNQSPYYGNCVLGNVSPVYYSQSTGSSDTNSDYSQISNAIYYLGATILVVCFFSVIYKMFIRLRG